MSTTKRVEEHLADLRARRAAVDAELGGLGPELERAEEALLQASQVFDIALAERLALEQDGGVTLRLTDAADVEVLPSGSETWTPQRRVGVEEERRLQERRAAAYGAWLQSDDELAAARVRYNDLQLRRSGLLMEGRSLDDRLAQAEAELEQAEQQPGDRDLLADIRLRLFGGAA
jgi:hypothetical protein